MKRCEAFQGSASVKLNIPKARLPFHRHNYRESGRRRQFCDHREAARLALPCGMTTKP